MSESLFPRDENGVPQPRSISDRMRNPGAKSQAERQQNIRAALILVGMGCATLVALCGLLVWAFK